MDQTVLRLDEEAAHHHFTSFADHPTKTESSSSSSSSSSFLSCIGYHEYFSAEMWRAALIELVATASLMFVLTTSIVGCLGVKPNELASPKLVVPFAVFIVAFLFLLLTVPLSGGHMSPVFTFIAALKGVVTWARASVYVPAQCIGSIIGFLILRSVMSHELAKEYSLGGCSITKNKIDDGGPRLSPETALVIEFCCTFVVLLIGVTVAFDKKRCKELGLVVVCGVVAAAMAVVVFVSITVTGREGGRAGYSGTGLNPARCLGPALLEGGELWDGHWVFWVGPFMACIVYYSLSLNFPRAREEEGDLKYDFFRLLLLLLLGRPRPRPSSQNKL